MKGSEAAIWHLIPIFGICTVLLQIGTVRLSAQTIQNPSFETPVVGPVGGLNSYQYNPTGAVWTFTGNCGIEANGSLLPVSPFSSDGNQVAFLGNAGSVISQTISNFPAGNFNYIFTFMAISWGNPSATVTVLVDSTNAGSITVPFLVWSFCQTAPILLSAGNHVLSFTGSGVQVDMVGLTVSRNARLPVKVATGWEHSLFVGGDGSLWGMGLNSYGQLGNGTINSSNRPLEIVPSGVTAIAAGGDGGSPGYGHTLFLKNDGSLWAMGYNTYGQLGDGNNTQKNRPERIAVTNATAIAAGDAHSLFLKSDGSLWAMGWNFYGQLGIGTYSQYQYSPVQMVASNVTTIAAGGGHSLFLKGDGSLWAVGYNYMGQLGDGTYSAAVDLPEMIVASNVTAIAGGVVHSLFLKSDESLWAMGDNGYGELGDGTYNNTNKPEMIVASNVTAIAAGHWHSLFLKSDGSLWGMGYNNQGQLGDGTLNSTNRPEQILAAPFGYNQISIQLLSGGDVSLSFEGLAGTNYALDYASSLQPPNWSPLVTNPAGDAGMVWFTNTPDLTTNNFWRIRSVP